MGPQIAVTVAMRTVTAATKTSEGWGAYIEGGARVETLDTVKAGHAMVLDRDLSAAYSINSTLSALYTVEHLTPLLEKALPAT